MTVKTKSPLIIAFCYLWIGFVCAISFVEAPLLLEFPGLNLSLGMEINRFVIGVINKIEWIFATIIILSIYPFAIEAKNKFRLRSYGAFLLFLIPVVILIIQSLWLLPNMNGRAELLVNGINQPSTDVKYYYLVAEAIKILSLFSLGITHMV